MISRAMTDTENWVTEEAYDWARFSPNGKHVFLRTELPLNATVSFQAYYLPLPDPESPVPAIRRGEPRPRIVLSGVHPRDAELLPGNDSILVLSGGVVDPSSAAYPTQLGSPTSASSSAVAFGSASHQDLATVDLSAPIAVSPKQRSPESSISESDPHIASSPGSSVSATPTSSPPRTLTTGSPTASSHSGATVLASRMKPTEVLLCQTSGSSSLSHTHSLNALARIAISAPIIRSIPIADRIAIMTAHKVYIFDVRYQTLLGSIHTTYNPNGAGAATSDARGRPLLAIPGVPQSMSFESAELKGVNDVSAGPARATPTGHQRQQGNPPHRGIVDVWDLHSLTLLCRFAATLHDIHVIALSPPSSLTNHDGEQDNTEVYLGVASSRSASVHVFSLVDPAYRVQGEISNNQTSSPTWEEVTAPRPTTVLTIPSVESKPRSQATQHDQSESKTGDPAKARLRPVHVCSLRRGIASSTANPAADGLCLSRNGSQLAVWTVGIIPELRIFDLKANTTSQTVAEQPEVTQLSPDVVSPRNTSEDKPTAYQNLDEEEWVLDFDKHQTDSSRDDTEEYDFCDYDQPLADPAGDSQLGTPPALPESEVKHDQLTNQESGRSFSTLALIKESTKRLGTAASGLLSYFSGSRSSVASTAAATAAATVNATVSVSAKVRETVEAGIVHAKRSATARSGRLIRLSPAGISRMNQDRSAEWNSTTGSQSGPRSDAIFGLRKSSFKVLSAAYLDPFACPSDLRLAVVTSDGCLTIFSTNAGEPVRIEAVYRLTAPSPYDTQVVTLAPFVLMNESSQRNE